LLDGAAPTEFSPLQFDCVASSAHPVHQCDCLRAGLQLEVVERVHWARGCDCDVEREGLSGEVLDPFGVEVQTPDEFVLSSPHSRLEANARALGPAAVRRDRVGRPVEKRRLPQTAAHLRDVVALI